MESHDAHGIEQQPKIALNVVAYLLLRPATSTLVSQKERRKAVYFTCLFHYVNFATYNTQMCNIKIDCTSIVHFH